MVAAIDYAGFPHIFAEVAAQSDIHTQNTLRFLSRSAKREVDRLQGRSPYPEIFAEMLWHCDTNTLRRLQLLSSWARREVSRHRCRAFLAFVESQMANQKKHLLTFGGIETS